MINSIYQLVAPRTVLVKFEDVQSEGKVIVRPRYMAVCHADQRYFQGRRDPAVMRKKLPMALIHECMGEVLHDPTGVFMPGEHVALIPNVAGRGPEYIYENYAEGSGFLSSGRDGFMREFVNLDPDRVVSCEGVDPQVAAITEFVSVTTHAYERFDRIAHDSATVLPLSAMGRLLIRLPARFRCLRPNQSSLLSAATRRSSRCFLLPQSVITRIAFQTI